MSKTTNEFSPEVRERAVRMVLDNEGRHGSRWQAVMSKARCLRPPRYRSPDRKRLLAQHFFESDEATLCYPFR